MKLLSKGAAVTAALLMTASAAVLSAPAASAATVTVHVTCDSDVDFYAEIGDTIVFDFADNAACDFAGSTNGTGIWNIDDNGDAGFLSTSMSPVYGSGAVDDTWYAYTSEINPQMTVTLNGSTTRSGSPVAVAPGDMVGQLFLEDGAGPNYTIRWLGTPPVVKDLTIQQLAYARASKDETCREGYSASWAQWPHDGRGGWVCEKSIYAYYPEETVR